MKRTIYSGLAAVLALCAWLMAQPADVSIVDDRTRLDENLGDVVDVIDAQFGKRPVYLVRLTAGRIIATRWTVGIDVPLLINGELIAWSEFEIVQSRLAIRLTELA